jgi:hypothetical protein
VAKGKWDSTVEFVRMTRRMVAAAGRRVGHADAEDLRELAGLRADVERAISAACIGMHEDGYSWKSIGEALGTTGQAAYMRYGKPKASGNGKG